MKPIAIKRRFFKVAWVFFKMLMDFKKEFDIFKKKGYLETQKIMEATHRKRATELYNVAIDLGGVLLKLCQFLSIRRDIFPEAYIEILSPLQDRVPPTPFEAIEGVLKNEYENYNTVFKMVDPTPIASASLGQTHKAILKNNLEVAVKVLKPDVEEVIDLDCAILHQVFKLFSGLEVFNQKGDFFQLLDEFIRVTGDELNFRREVWFAKEFKKHFKGKKNIIIPEVFEEFCTDRIIVMEFMEGDKIGDVEKWIERNNDPVLISRQIIDIYMEQFLFFKLIHYDPHPGNILVKDNNQIVLLDYGMAGEITDKMSSGLKDLIKAFARRDYRGIIDILSRLGFVRKGVSRKNLISLASYFFDEILETIKFEKESIQNIDLSPVIDDLVEVLYTLPINLPVEWAFIGKTVGVLVGIIAILYPDINVYDEISPYAERLLKNNLESISEEVFDRVKNDGEMIMNLPRRLESILNNVEDGYLKFKVDFEEVDDKLEDLQAAVIKGIGFGVTFFSGVAGYMVFALNLIDKMGFALPLFALSGLSLIFAITYTKKSGKDNLKRIIEGD